MEENGRGLVGGRVITRRNDRDEKKKGFSPERDRLVVVGGRGKIAAAGTVKESTSHPQPGPTRDHQRRGIKVFKKVQVVYYLTRNGQLEHPHFMEVPHLANQHVRLKDFIERLTLLRGKGIPSQYSWSCKRSYKNWYVWNDLTDNDIMYPSEGAEYILKGSEIIHQSSSAFAETDKLQQLQKSYNSKLKLHSLPPSILAPAPPPLDPPKEQALIRMLVGEENKCKEETVEFGNDKYYSDEDELHEEEKNSYTSSNIPHSHCSKGVSTDELHVLNGSTRTAKSDDYNDRSPTLSTTCSTISSKKGVGGAGHHHTHNNQSSERFVVIVEEDGDPPTKNSVLLQLISCGGSVAAKGGKSIPCLKQQTSRAEGNHCGGDRLRRGLVCSAATEKVAVAAEDEEEIIKYMSENPRFGNLQSEEKEYFSGSILEAMNSQGRAYQVEPLLKKSSSYKEERGSSKTGLEETSETTDHKEEIQRQKRNGLVKGKCIPNPRRKNPSHHRHQHHHHLSTSSNQTKTYQ